MVRERIGQGGFGAIYRCEQPLLRREAVIKILHRERRVSPAAVQRFLREAQLASRLDHPYAAHIYGFGIEERDKLLWIAMELVQGVTLADWLTAHGPMPLARCVPFLEHIAEVVQTAHDRGIVHRDLKPSNVMVLDLAGELLPKLLDFGVAKLLDGAAPLEGMPGIDYRSLLVAEDLPGIRLADLEDGKSTVTGPAAVDSKPDSNLTPRGHTVGSPAYISPEQWNHAVTVWPAADLYALAVVAFEALTGRKPFVGATMAEYEALHCRGEIPSLGAHFPPALDRMFQRALAKRPADRWGTALELAGALRAASGIGTTRSDLPRIDQDVRDAWLSGAPQPLAESVAVLDSACNAHQAHIATHELARNLLRYLVSVALAMHAQAREGRDDPALLELVRALDRRELITEERVRLLRLLVRPLTSRRSAPLVSDLVGLVTPDRDGADALDPVLSLDSATDHAGAEDVVRLQLMRLLPELTRLLRKTRFVLDYVLVVPQRLAAERWMGRRSSQRAVMNVSNGELVDGHPTLLDREGRVCVDLWPLMQVMPEAEGAEPELLLYDGHGHQGARMLAASSGIEHNDSTARDWVANHVLAEIEARTRIHEQIRIAARQWQDRARPDDLLWRGEVLADLERWTRHTSQASLSDLETSFIAASRRAARRTRWIRRLLVAVAISGVLAAIEYHAASQTRMAEQIAEVEQGRQALLHDEFAEAQLHLAEAYQRGDHSPGTTFMLARALQPVRAEQARFTATSGHMWSAAFSPDGKQIITTDDKAARVWDARTHQQMFTLLHGDVVYDAHYSADGTRLMTACGDGTVRIWDSMTGALVRTLQPPAGSKSFRYFIVVVSPDERLVAAIDTAGQVAHVWDPVSGEFLAELRNNASDYPSIAFSADSRWLATSGGDDVRVFDTRSWKQALTLAGPRIRALSFDPKGPQLATASAVGDASIWEIPSGARTQHLREIGALVRVVVFSADGQLVATGGGDSTVQIWDARSGALRNQLNAARGKILSIEFDPTSTLVVAGSDRGTVLVAEALGMPVTVFDMPQGVFRTTHFDPSAHRVVGASWGGTARVWDATSPYRRWGSPPVATDCGVATSLEPDRRFIATGCRNHNTRIWDTAHDRLLAELPDVTPVAGDFTSAFPAVSALGDRAAIAHGDTVEVYDLPTSKLIRVVRHGAAVNAVAFAPTGHDLISGATDGSLVVTRDGSESFALPTSAGGIDTVGLLADGRAVSSDARGRLQIYDVDRVAVIADLELPTRVRLLRPSPDGLRLVTIPSFTGKAVSPQLWDLKHYLPIAQLPGHVGQAFSARYTDGGRAVLTVGADGAVQLWNGETGRLLTTYRSTSRYLMDAVVTADGSMVIAGGSDGLLWFWDRTTAQPLWTLQAHNSDIVGIHLEGDAVVTRGFAGDVSRWVLPKSEQVIDAFLADR